MAISIFIFPLVCAAEFQFDSPKEAELKTSFSVTLESDSSETSDVKIFIQDTDSKTISQTYTDGNWKSSYYYLKSVFPGKKEFEIQALKSGSFSLCARLRPTGKSSFSEKCNPITISEGTNSKIEDTTTEKEDTPSITNKDKEDTPTNEEADPSKEETSTEEDEAQSSPTPSPSLQSLSANIIKSPSTQQAQSGKIILNQPNAEKTKEYLTKDGKTQQYLLYSFIILCITIIILFAIKRF